MNDGRIPPKGAKTGLVLGLSAFAKISAVEGVRLKDSSAKMFADFEKDGLSPEERRKAILAKHAQRPGRQGQPC